MKKLLSIILALTLILPCISAFALDVSAEDEYADLWKEKIFYQKQNEQKSNPLYSERQMENYTLHHNDGEYTFVMFTEIGRKLTYLIEDADSEELMGLPVDSDYIYGDKVLTCVELAAIHDSTYVKEDSRILGKTSTYRKIIKELGLTRDEVEAAYQEMKEHPESIASLLPTSDEGFINQFIIEVEYSRYVQDFIIEAAFMKDDHAAESLLTRSFGIYIEELGYTVQDSRVLDRSDFTLNALSKLDLTTLSFVAYVDRLHMNEGASFKYDYILYSDEVKARIDAFYDIKVLQDKQLQEKLDTEKNYKELFAEKLSYEADCYGQLRYSTNLADYRALFYGDFAGEGGDFWGYGYEFLPFTEKGQKLTYEFFEGDWYYEGAYFSGFWNIFYGEVAYTCIELSDILSQSSKKYNDEAYIYKSKYRSVVQALGITEEELREAYRKMVEEPEYARKVLTNLSDEEFELYAKYLKTVDIPENFMIEAACMKNEEQAQTLLAYPGIVYVKELEYCIHAKTVFMFNWIPIEEVLEFDLTTDSFKLFVQDIAAYFAYDDEILFDEFGIKDDKGRTPRENHLLLVAEHEKQMAQAPSTGEALYLIPVALVSLALGALVIYPRRRKIDNI